MMHPRTLPAMLALVLATGCSGLTSDSVVVGGTGDEEFLNMRAGPGLGFSVILGVPEGTALNRKSCVTELGQLWCEVSLPSAPRFTGYVSADYLVAPEG